LIDDDGVLDPAAVAAAEAFLRRVHPAQGFHCLAMRPVAWPKDRPGFLHTSVGSPLAAATVAVEHASSDNVYFAVCTMREKEYVGADGKKHWREKSNAFKARAFAIDIDVGATDDQMIRAATQRDGVAAILDFVTTAQIPPPNIFNNSGNGVHVYWVMQDDMEVSEWVATAEKLGELLRHYQVPHDPSKVSDASMVLRVPGTLNNKAGRPPKPVFTHTDDGQEIPNAAFYRAVSDAHIRAGIVTVAKSTRSSSPTNLSPVQSRLLATLGDNTKREYDGPKADIEALCRACPFIYDLMMDQEKQSQSAWYFALSTIRCLEDGENLIHEFSKEHPDYDYDHTEQKVAQAMQFGPTSCLKMHEVGGGKTCEACPHWDPKGSGFPINFAKRYVEVAAPKLVVGLTEGEEEEIELVNPPDNYRRQLGHAGIVKIGVGADGKSRDDLIYDGDLYPTRLVRNTRTHEYSADFVAYPPKREPVQFSVPMSTLYRTDLLTELLANQTVLPDPTKVQELKQYMVVYIKKLQAHVEDQMQHTHLGWTDTYDAFVLPKQLILADRVKRDPNLTKTCREATTHVGTDDCGGTLEQQYELLKFYAKKKYLKNQFVIAASLAASVFHMTEHHGVILNLYGPTGASKSTTMFAAASLWGHPDKMPLSGLQSGMTENGRNSHMKTHSNMPLLVDEVTFMDPKPLREMCLSVSQTRPGKVMSLRNGDLKPAISDSKSIVMITTSNSAIHAKLALGNQSGTASSMRVFEIHFPELVYDSVEARSEAVLESNVFLSKLRKCYGHIAPPFIQFVRKHMPEIQRRIDEKHAALIRLVGASAAERFWDGLAAATLVTLEIAEAESWLPFSAAEVEAWFVNEQLPMMRDDIDAHYDLATDTLSNFLAQNVENILLVRTQDQSEMIVENAKRSIYMRYNVTNGELLISRDRFNNYLEYIGKDRQSVIGELTKTGVFRPQRGAQDRVWIGAGTILGKSAGRPWVYRVDMKHPAISTEIAEVQERDQKVIQFVPREVVLTPPEPAPAPAPAKKTRTRKSSTAAAKKTPTKLVEEPLAPPPGMDAVWDELDKNGDGW